MPVIQLDPATLPQHRSKVKWQRIDNVRSDVWKTGYYLATGQKFVKGELDDEYDSAWFVDRWEPIT
ncbi:hypothetical protein [Rufibacter sp. XAAS-G3-1]|uniref:hypothetical protein n=1 Tax=Rufibacter sp. XAAS-G3-1 TaxID=2729134 RepID=UPI0015E71A3B|nr:hypothetical protein [Rufibacter sp. XAAS-G3-1]